MQSSQSIPVEQHPFGLPMGTVRGFMSVLICSFFWILLLYPWEVPPPVPLAHFFLLTLVFLSFASHPIQEVRASSFLPWLMRLIFVGGSFVVLFYSLYNDPNRLSAQLTPNAEEIQQWPTFLACLAGGFGSMLLLRSIFGRDHNFFMTIRAWIGVLAVLLLMAETLFQLAILPSMSDKPSQEAMKIWEGLLIAIVAAYFGARA